MAESKGVADIEHSAFQSRELAVQRVAWLLLGLLLVVTFLGVLGNGPLSGTTKHAADDSLTIEYDRFIRHLGMTRAEFDFGQAAVSDGTVTLLIDRELADGWNVQNVTPQPSTESSSKDWLIYEFDVLGQDPPHVTIEYRGDGFGLRSGEVRAGDSAVPVSLWQWSHP